MWFKTPSYLNYFNTCPYLSLPIIISGYIWDTLHWLPIQQRVQFKILSLMRNCLVGVAPSYLRSFCTFVSSLPARASLRSSTRGLMVVPRMRSATAHSRCFSSFPVLAHLIQLSSQSLRLFRV